MNPNDQMTIRRGLDTVNTGSTYAEHHFQGLSPEALRDIARNDSARKDWRLAAAAKLHAMGHHFYHHPDVKALYVPDEPNFDSEPDGPVDTSFEFTASEICDAVELYAGVTTSTLMQDSGAPDGPSIEETDPGSGEARFGSTEY